MATSLPVVHVGRIEADQGFLITCSHCPQVRTIRPSRYQADLYATEHRASHNTPNPTDQIGILDDPWSTP